MVYGEDHADRAKPATLRELFSNVRKNYFRLYFHYAYFNMNERGYGVVSLYHNMIAELDETLVNEHEISRRILNLPLHQDIESDQLDEMLEILIEMVESHKRRSIII